MMKKYEVEEIIKNALEELNGKIVDSKLGDGTSTVFEASVEEDENGDLIFLFKEDMFSEYTDRYRIKIEYM